MELKTGKLVALSRRAILLGLALLPVAGAALAQEVRPIKIGTPSVSVASANLRVASQMGLFDKYNLRPEFVRLENGSVATTAVISGSVEFTISGLSDLLAAQASGQDIVTIGNLYAGFANSLVLSNATVESLGVAPDAPVEERIASLDGLLIAGASATFVGTLATKAAALDSGVEIRWTYMAQDNMPSALESGAIQGYIGATPASVIPVMRGLAVTWLSGPRGEFPHSPLTSSVLQVRRDFADANPDLVTAMQSVMADFAAEVANNPEGVKEAMVALYPTLDPAIIDIFLAEEAGTAWKGVPLTAEEMAHEIQFMRDSGVMPAEQLDALDPARIVYP